MFATDPDDLPPWRLVAAPIAAVLGFIIAEILVTVTDGIGGAAGGSISHPTPAMAIIGSIVFDLGFIAAVVIVARIDGGARPQWFGFRRVHLLTAVIAFVVAAILYYLVTDLYAALFSLHGQDNLPSEFGVRRSDWAIAGTAVFVCAVAPMCEETIFRGFLFGTLRKWHLPVAGRELGPWVAAVIVAILFGLAHTGSANPEYLVPLGFLGFVLCLVRWRTRSLYPAWALHSANNSVALAVQLHWSVGAAAALLVGSWLVIAVIVGPLGMRSPALA